MFAEIFSATHSPEPHLGQALSLRTAWTENQGEIVPKKVDMCIMTATLGSKMGISVII